MRRSSIQLTAIILLTSHATLGKTEVVSQFVCKNNSLTRIVSHRIFEKDGAPCDVLYEKPNEGGYRKSEWQAENEAKYCTWKYVDFLKKLRGMGWDCQISTKKKPVRIESPFIRIVAPSHNKPLAIYNSNLALVGFTGDYIQISEGKNKYVVHSHDRARVSINVLLNSKGSLKTERIEAFDSVGMCPDRNVAKPATILDAWPAGTINRTSEFAYNIELGTPTFKPRPMSDCVSTPSEITGLKWSSAKLTIQSNVDDASIYQKEQSGNFHAIKDVFPGTKFSAVYRQQIDSDLSFTLRRKGYTNCSLSVSVPLISDEYTCDMTSVEDLF